MKKAFTLIELLLVLSILFSIISLAFFVYEKVIEQVRINTYQDVTDQLLFAINDMDSTYNMAGGKSEEGYDSIIKNGGMFNFYIDPEKSIIYPFLSKQFKNKYIIKDQLNPMVDIGLIPTQDGKYRYLGVMFPLASDPTLQKICPSFLAKYRNIMFIGGAIQSGIVKNPTMKDIDAICNNNSYEIYIADKNLKFITPS